jgi:hypothetical protein
VDPADSGSGHCQCPQTQVPQLWTMTRSRRLVKPVPCLMSGQAPKAVTVLTTLRLSVLSRKHGTEGRDPKASHSRRPKRSLPHRCAVSRWSKMSQSSCQKVGQCCPKTRGPEAFASPWNTKDITYPMQMLRVTQQCQPSKIQMVHNSPTTGIFLTGSLVTPTNPCPAPVLPLAPQSSSALKFKAAQSLWPPLPPPEPRRLLSSPLRWRPGRYPPQEGPLD